MVRKQNERTLLLHSRIITLSLPTKTLFLILAPRPLSTRLGAFSSPETFFHKFFPKFFPIRPRRTFFYFYGAKKYGGRRLLPLPRWGGVSLLYALYTSNRYSILSSFLPPFLPPSWQIFRQSGQIFGKKGQKLDFIWCGFVFSRDFRRPKRTKFKIYLIFEGAGASVVALTLGRWSRPLGADVQGTLAILLTLAR